MCNMGAAVAVASQLSGAEYDDESNVNTLSDSKIAFKSHFLQHIYDTLNAVEA